MTTDAQQKYYESQHATRWGSEVWAVHNPHNKPVDELPVIYGWNNGSTSAIGGFMYGELVAEDGTLFPGHACTSEVYMPYDLGILKGSRPDRHENFRTHYPDGYRMVFVSYEDVQDHAGLQAAFKLIKEGQMTLFGIKEMQEFASNHDDARVRAMWRRLSEARSKNAQWCEHANQQDAKLDQIREAWSEYTDYLREKYPPSGGKDFELTCPHHHRINELLKQCTP